MFQREVLDLLSAFWDGRDMRQLHHPVWFRQFAEDALAARRADGSLCGYLLGCVTPRVGYVHLVATLPDVRGAGVARQLYAGFAAAARTAGAPVVEAITTSGNSGSISFHQRLGFTATAVQDYAGPGEDRVHFAAPTDALVTG